MHWPKRCLGATRFVCLPRHAVEHRCFAFVAFQYLWSYHLLSCIVIRLHTYQNISRYRTFGCDKQVRHMAMCACLPPYKQYGWMMHQQSCTLHGAQALENRLSSETAARSPSLISETIANGHDSPLGNRLPYEGVESDRGVQPHQMERDLAVRVGRLWRTFDAGQDDNCTASCSLCPR